MKLKKRAKIIIFLITIIVIGIIGFLVYKNFFGKNETEGAKVINSIEDYGYTLKDNKNWNLRQDITKKLIKREITIDQVTADDVQYDLRQKGIDMKIGVDIASLALKKFVDKIVLIAGDSDFVPAAKLARREGIDFVLDPMHSQHVENSLYEHIDGLRSIPMYYQIPPKKRTSKKNAVE